MPRVSPFQRAFSAVYVSRKCHELYPISVEYVCIYLFNRVLSALFISFICYWILQTIVLLSLHCVLSAYVPQAAEFTEVENAPSKVTSENDGKIDSVPEKQLPAVASTENSVKIGEKSDASSPASYNLATSVSTTGDFNSFYSIVFSFKLFFENIDEYATFVGFYSFSRICILQSLRSYNDEQNTIRF